MKKETIIAILGTILGAFVIIMIIGLATPEEKMVSMPIEGDTMASFKADFIAGCTEDETSSYYQCNCAYNELEKEYGKDGLLDMSIDYLKTEQFPERAISVILKCY